MTKPLDDDFEITFRPARNLGREFEVRGHVYRRGGSKILHTVTAVGPTPKIAKEKAEEKARDFVNSLDNE